jgi:hypothetical protein
MALPTPKLLCLPQELREKVWHFAIANEPEAFVLQPGMKPSRFFYPNSLPPIAFIHPSLFDEVFLVWVRSRTLKIHFNTTIPASFVAWMDTAAQGRAWVNVKSLSFTAALRVYQAAGISGPTTYHAGDIVARAKTLQHLTITISSLSVTHFDPKTGYFTHIKPMDEVLATLDFSTVLRCERLKTLMIYCCPTWKGDLCLEADDLNCRPHDMFVPLCHWFLGKFDEQGRTVEVRGKLDRRGKKWSDGSGWDWMGRGS